MTVMRINAKISADTDKREIRGYVLKWGDRAVSDNDSFSITDETLIEIPEYIPVVYRGMNSSVSKIGEIEIARKNNTGLYVKGRIENYGALMLSQSERTQWSVTGSFKLTDTNKKIVREQKRGKWKIKNVELSFPYKK